MVVAVVGWLILGGFGSGPEMIHAEAITGICPDGSLYIVQSAAKVPCRNSKRVRPEDVPPVRPQYRPTPYTWDVWNQRNDPNNPYNLIDSARQVREFQAALPGLETAPAPGMASQPNPAGSGAAGSATAPVASAPRGDVRPLDLGLSDQELRDLHRIVELSQEHAPAHIGRRTADGKGIFEVAFAHSRAFEGVLHRAWSSRGGLAQGPVLIFTARSKRPEAFHANFTVLQGHLSYQPDARDARQLGILQGRLGDLEANEIVTGYVVLPDAMDLSKDVELYWNDRRTRARLGARRAAQN
ncbi:MAG: hypothetical protein GY723_02170 [bacterium]|nr:hypothetical protein [bacterium]